MLSPIQRDDNMLAGDSSILRNKQRPMLRTKKLSSMESQIEFLSSATKDPNARWYNWNGNLVGLVPIDWENSQAELSMLLPEEYYSQPETVMECIEELLEEAFKVYALRSVRIEVYKCSPFYPHWSYILKQNLHQKYKIKQTTIPARKYWNGKYQDSLYIVIFNKGE